MLNRADLTEQEQLRELTIHDRLLTHHAMGIADARTYALICIERARAYAAHVQAMKVHPYLRIWVQDMVAHSGKARIFVYHNYLPWLEAFMVVRYGEAVGAWPMTLTEKDVQRARDWKSGVDVPKVVTV